MVQLTLRKVETRCHHGSEPQFLELLLEPHQRVVSIVWRKSAFEDLGRKTVDWYGDVWIETTC